MAGRTSAPLPPHGTRERYQSRVDPCRCPACRRVNAARQAHYRRTGTTLVGRVLDGGAVQLAIPHRVYEPVTAQ